jgi:biotin carboxyl carrier protein
MSQSVSALSQVSGAIWKIHVIVGATVHEDDVLGVVEAMKMEIPILSPCDGIITQIFCAEGEIVEEGQPLISIDPNDARHGN